MQRFAPVVLPSLGVSISQSGRYVELLVADCGLEVAFDGVHRVAVRVPKETHSGENTVENPSPSAMLPRELRKVQMLEWPVGDPM